jgi:hypothetical protein
MRDAENESHEGKRKAESLWPIMRISHARSRYIYELYYKREAISRELYDWLLKEGYADAKYVHQLPVVWPHYLPCDSFELGCKVEEDGLRKVVLSAVHPDKGEP